jgi:hypothetical protein
VNSRRLVLGDWSPLVRDAIDVLRAGLVVAAVATVAGGDTGAAVSVTAVAVLGLLARVVKLPRAYDWGLMAVLTVHGVGEALGWYDGVPWFDRLVHVVLPCLVAPVLYIGLARLDVLPDPRDETHVRHYVGMGVVTFCLGMTVGGVWEVVEWISDASLGSDLSEGNDDTVGDLVADGSGSLLGALLLVAWARWGWGSVRRVPGTNAYEDADA